jgi:hypothetical protein
MPTDPDNDAVTTLVAAALFAPSPTDLLARAAALARSASHRQLVAIASAHVAGDHDRVHMLAGDHDSDHRGGVLVAWMVTATGAANVTITTDRS